MNKTDVTRIAAAINQLRPDWGAPELRSFIWKSLTARPAADVMVALALVALDPDTRTPARVLASGPWWQATRPAGDPGAPQPDQIHSAEICRVCRKTRAGHDHMAAISGDDHAFTIKPESPRQADRTGPRMVHGPRTTHQDTPASTDALASAFQKETRS